MYSLFWVHYDEESNYSLTGTMVRVVIFFCIDFLEVRGILVGLEPLDIAGMQSYIFYGMTTSANRRTTNYFMNLLQHATVQTDWQRLQRKLCCHDEIVR